MTPRAERALAAADGEAPPLSRREVGAMMFSVVCMFVVVCLLLAAFDRRVDEVEARMKTLTAEVRK